MRSSASSLNGTRTKNYPTITFPQTASPTASLSEQSSMRGWKFGKLHDTRHLWAGPSAKQEATQTSLKVDPEWFLSYKISLVLTLIILHVNYYQETSVQMCSEVHLKHFYKYSDPAVFASQIVHEIRKVQMTRNWLKTETDRSIHISHLTQLGQQKYTSSGAASKLDFNSVLINGSDIRNTTKQIYFLKLGL